MTSSVKPFRYSTPPYFRPIPSISPGNKHTTLSSWNTSPNRYDFIVSLALIYLSPAICKGRRRGGAGWRMAARSQLSRSGRASPSLSPLQPAAKRPTERRKVNPETPIPSVPSDALRRHLGTLSTSGCFALVRRYSSSSAAAHNS
jgi:hypothetical protein